MKSYDYEIFWTTSQSIGASPLSQFYTIFLLVGLWAIAEIYSAMKLNYRDKYFCLSICSVLIAIISFSQVIFSEEQEFLESEYRIRTNKPITFRLNEIPYIPRFTKWDEFKWLKVRNERNFFHYRFSDKDWEGLENEFVNSGGVFEIEELAYLRVNPRSRPYFFFIDGEFWYWASWANMFLALMFFLFTVVYSIRRILINNKKGNYQKTVHHRDTENTERNK